MPGIVFRSVVYDGSVVQRFFTASNSIYLISTITFISIIIHLLVAVGYTILSKLVILIVPVDVIFNFEQFGGKLYAFHAGRRYELIQFAIKQWYIATLYLLILFGTAYYLARWYGEYCFRSHRLAKIIYGPLATLIVGKDKVVVDCYVVTKTKHDNKYLMFKGFLEEVSFKDGNCVDHLILRDTSKFYLRMNNPQPITSLSRQRTLNSEYSQGLLYLSGEQLENVQFQVTKFY